MKAHLPAAALEFFHQAGKSRLRKAATSISKERIGSAKKASAKAAEVRAKQGKLRSEAP